MPFPPISLHQRISSPGRELFGKKKTTGVPPPQNELSGRPAAEKGESDKEKPSISWPAANLRNLGRKAPQAPIKSSAQKPSAAAAAAAAAAATSAAATAAATAAQDQTNTSWLVPPKPQDSSDGVRRSGSAESNRQIARKEDARKEKEVQFTLSLTPEAILVIQKRNLEKQMMAKQQKCCASADFRHRRVFPSKKAHGGAKNCASAAKAESAEQDITAIVKISLLNDQYKYDDVEYEEEDGDVVDETVVRKCKEWLRGVESAAALGKSSNFLHSRTLKAADA